MELHTVGSVMNGDFHSTLYLWDLFTMVISLCYFIYIITLLHLWIYHILLIYCWFFWDASILIVFKGMPSCTHLCMSYDVYTWTYAGTKLLGHQICLCSSIPNIPVFPRGTPNYIFTCSIKDFQFVYFFCKFAVMSFFSILMGPKCHFIFKVYFIE